MGEVLKRLKDATDSGLARIGPEIEAGIIADRIKEKGVKRAETFKKALDVADKLRAELNKIKPDVAAIKKEDGAVLQEAGWTDKNLKLRKETLERFLSLEALIEKTSQLQMADDPNGQAIAEAYAKLAQGTDKASKGVSKDAAAESDDA